MLSRLHLKTEKARRTLHEFVVQAWPLLEPATPFVEGMHVRAVCEHLQAVAQGRLRHLIINIPPGHAKSLLTAVFWPAWVWIDHPEARWLFSSYREPLATRDSVKCRRLIESDWYQERWGDSVPAQRRPEPEEPLRKYQNWLPGSCADVGGHWRARRLRGGG